jgi:hypothetical protein
MFTKLLCLRAREHYYFREHSKLVSNPRVALTSPPSFQEAQASETSFAWRVCRSGHPILRGPKNRKGQADDTCKSREPKALDSAQKWASGGVCMAACGLVI